MNQFAGQKLRHRCREQMYGHQGGKAVGGGGVVNWAIGINMYTLMCIKMMTNKNLLYKKINKIKFKKKKQQGKNDNIQRNSHVITRFLSRNSACMKGVA